jgi:hypothetical protein
LPCDMVEASDFTPALICNYTTTTAATLDQGGGKRRSGDKEPDSCDDYHRPLSAESVISDHI